MARRSRQAVWKGDLDLEENRTDSFFKWPIPLYIEQKYSDYRHFPFFFSASLVVRGQQGFMKRKTRQLKQYSVKEGKEFYVKELEHLGRLCG